MHTHGFDNIDPIDYAINKRNLFLSDVLMKHERQQLSSASSNISNDGHQHSLNNSQHNNQASTESTPITQNTTNNNSNNHQPQSLNDSVFQSD